MQIKTFKFHDLFHLLPVKRIPFILLSVFILLQLSPGIFRHGLTDIWALPQNETLFQEGVALYYKGDINGSIDTFNRLLKCDPGNRIARMNLVHLLWETGAFDEAAEHLNLLVARHPESLDYRLALLQTNYLRGRPELAVGISLSLDKTADLLFWKGLALYDLKEIKAARAVLKRSVEKNSFNPIAYYILGLISLEDDHPEEAKSWLLQALKQEPNLTVAFYPLARTYIGLKQFDMAYQYLQKAESASPWNPRLSETIQGLILDHPELVAERREEDAARRERTVPPRAAVVVKDEGIPALRIGLAEKAQELRIKTGAAFALMEPDGKKGISGEAHQELILRASAGTVEVVSKQGAVLLNSSQPLTLTYRDRAATTAVFDLEFGRGYYWAGQEDRFYRGRLEFLPTKNGLTVINILNLEEYLYSVIPAEMPSSWPAAALQAQAIAARSYTMAMMGIGRYSERGFDLFGSVLSMEYKGLNSETPPARAAVDATRGVIMRSDGKPVTAYFSANAGGYTENSEDVWGFKNSYLQAVPDKMTPPRTDFLPPYDLAAWLTDRPATYSSNPVYSARSAFRWMTLVPREEIEARLNSEKKIGKVISIITAGRGISGRVKKVVIKGTTGEITVSGDSIRTKLGGLRSSLFVVRPKLGPDGLPEYFLFTGGGWGHGVGMCQSGAAGMAADGFTAQEILTHYYPGVEIAKIY